MGAGVRWGRAFNRGRIGDGSWIAHRFAFLIARFGRPNGDELGFASFSRAVGLLARAIGDFFATPGYARAIPSEVQGGSRFAGPCPVLAFIHRDRRSQRFGSPFDLLGADFYARPLAP